MYKSPIEICVRHMQNEIDSVVENEVYKTILDVGVYVDKEELIRALQYDREQYAKGYRDGIQEFAERLSAKATSYMNEGSVSVVDIDNLVKEMLPAEKLATESDARDIENYEIAHRVRMETINEFVEKLKQCGRYPQCRPFPDNPVLKQNRIWLEEDIDSLVNYESSKMTE